MSYLVMRKHFAESLMYNVIVHISGIMPKHKLSVSVMSINYSNVDFFAKLVILFVF
jgi:hypothetical protein